MGLKVAQLAASDMSIRFLLLEHIKALEAAGHSVTAICAPGPWVEEIRAQGVKIETLEISREPDPAQDIRTLRALYRLFRRGRFDVVHTHTPKAGLLGPVAAQLARVPKVVHTIHGLLFHDQMPRARRMMMWMPERFTSTWADVLLSQSQEDMGRALATGLCGKSKIHYLGNGIEVARFTPPAQRPPREKFGLRESDVVIGSVGRLVYEKGFAELFEAAEMVKEKHPEARFVIVGPREDHTQSDAIDGERLARLEGAGTVMFPQFQKDMAAWYAQMDIFVLPSHREGIPRACMEAACMGLPVIASDIRGCREVVVGEKTGILVPVRNAKALAAAMMRLIGDKQLRREMGARGSEHIRRNFDQKDVLARLCGFYAGWESAAAAARATTKS